MRTFNEFLQEMGWDDDNAAMYDQQEKDWAALKELIDDYNQFEDRKMSVSHAGTGFDNPQDSDHFTLYIGGEEITQGDLGEIMQRVKQIRKENGYM